MVSDQSIMVFTQTVLIHHDHSTTSNQSYLVGGGEDDDDMADMNIANMVQAANIGLAGGMAL